MVEVFKTNVKSEQSAQRVISKLSKTHPEAKISFDLEDCDNILRVAFHSKKADIKRLKEIVASLGFSIQVLK